MQYVSLPFIGGIVKNPHQRLITDDRASDGNNVIFEEGKVKRRKGYVQLGTNLPLSGPVVGFENYIQTGTGNSFVIAFTTRDSYYYDSSSEEWKYCTLKYSVNTVTCTGTTTVTGADTGWDTDWPTGVYRIAFGTTDINNSSATWYTINTWTNANSLELTASGPSVSANVYVIRRCWSGDIDDHISTATPMDGADRVVVATNGVDPPQVWDGTNCFVTLGDTGKEPNYCKYFGWFGSAGAERLYSGWTIDTGVSQSMTIEMSNVGDINDWTTGQFYDLFENDDEITGFTKLLGTMYIFKERSVSEAVASGSSTNPLDIYQNKIDTVGAPTINAVVPMTKYLYFFGSDTRIWMWDGVNLVETPDSLAYTLKSSINQAMLRRSFALNLLEDDLIAFFVPTTEDYPDKAFVYDHKARLWTIWTLAHQMTACGAYNPTEAALSWSQMNTSGETWSDMLSAGSSWADMVPSAGKRRYVLGDKDGYIYTFGEFASDDDGTAISAFFQTKDYPLNDPKQAFKILEFICGAEPSTGTLSVRCSTDFGVTWSDWVTLDQTGSTDYTEMVANFDRVGKQVRFQIQNNSGSYFEIESFVVGYIDYGIMTGR